MIKDWVLAISFGSWIGSNLTMLITFFKAYLTPEKAVTVYIDLYHEANIEAIILPLFFIISLFGARIIYKNYRDKHGRTDT